MKEDIFPVQMTSRLELTSNLYFYHIWAKSVQLVFRSPGLKVPNQLSLVNSLKKKVGSLLVRIVLV